MKNQDQVLIDGLLENHVGLAFVWERRTWEILPWLSFKSAYIETFYQPLHGLWTLLHIIKDEKAGGKTLTVSRKKKKQQLFIGLISYEWIFSRGNSNSIHPPRLGSWLLWHGPVLAGLLNPYHYLQLKVCKDGATCNTTWTSCFCGWIDSRLPRRTFHVENRCKRKPVVCKW